MTPQMTPEEARAYVAKGAAWLDGDQPGWAPKIDVGRLSMSNCEDCVYGQLAGNYIELYVRLGQLGIEHQADFARTHGFTHAWARNYPLLVDAWIAEIAARVVPTRHRTRRKK